MLQFDELKLLLEDIYEPLKDLAEAIGLSKIKEEIKILEEKSMAPDFWNDMENSHSILTSSGNLGNKLTAWVNDDII